MILMSELNKLPNYLVITNDELDEFPDSRSYNPDILKIVITSKIKKQLIHMRLSRLSKIDRS